MIVDLVVIFMLIGLSAFFSGAETALTALDPVRTQKLIDADNFWSGALKLWRDRPLAVLTCILIGNNIVNISASVMADHATEDLLAGSQYAETSTPLAVGVMTFLVLTFGEITPKTIAKARSQELAGKLMWAMRLPFLLFTPLTIIFTGLSRALMRLTGSELEDARPHVTEEDIEYMVELGSREGNIEDRKERMLQSVFEFSTTRVRELMIPRIDMVAIGVNDTLPQILDKLITSGHSRLPVYDGTVDNIVGLFYAKDMLRHMQRNDDAPRSFEIGDYMRKAYFVPETKSISDLLAEFQKDRIHMAIVVGEFGGTSGLITIEDIIEEVLGDIQDEYDAEEDYYQQLGEGHLLAQGRCPLDVLEEDLDISFPDHPEYDSLGGFILARTGALPTVGTEVVHGDTLFRVTQADAKRVIQVEIVHRPGSSIEDSDPGLRRLAV